jgi:hypothetical protein
MAKKVSKYPSWATGNGPVLAGQEANLVQGVFVGMDANGDVKPADYRQSAGPVPALGFVIADVGHKDMLGNTLFNDKQVAWSKEGKIAGCSGLTIGATYYMTSGGAITATPPAATTGDIDQAVGIAVSATELEVLTSGPVKHA